VVWEKALGTRRWADVERGTAIDTLWIFLSRWNVP